MVRKNISKILRSQENFNLTKRATITERKAEHKRIRIAVRKREECVPAMKYSIPNLQY